MAEVSKTVTPSGVDTTPPTRFRNFARRATLLAPETFGPALKQAFIMLRPDIQWKNPVMFVVEIGTALTILFTVATLLGYPSQVGVGYLISLDIWLFLTVLFANFASALAEARGKAQADALRKTRRQTPAFRLKSYAGRSKNGTPVVAAPVAYAPGSPDIEEVSSTDLQA